MPETTIFLILILFIVACEAVAQSCANRMRHTGSVAYLIAGGLFYTLVVYLLSKAHEHAPMGVVNAIWSGVSIITITSVGYIAFGQKISIDQLSMMGVIAIGVAYLALELEPTPG